MIRTIGSLGIGGLLVAVGLGAPKPAGSAPAAAPELRKVSDAAWSARIEGGPHLLMIPQRSVPMFSCTVFVPAGSALETPATNGAAHYLEHLLFNGTTRRTREEIYATGDRLGAYNNASTQRERTVFQLLLPSENWRAGLDLQADMLLESTLPPEMFEKEKGIILEELAKDRTNPEYEAELFANRVLWGEDARALPVLGTESSISNMDYDALVGFYRGRYRPAGMKILLMGDFDPAEALAEIARLYGGRAGEAPPFPARPAFPAGRSIRAQSVTGLDHVRLRVMLPLPALAPDELVTARILEDLLGNGERSSLSRAVEAAGIRPLGAWASVDPGEPGSVLTLAAELPSDALGGEIPGTETPAAGNLLAHLARFAEIGPGPDELEAARRSFAADEIGLQEKMHYLGLMRADVLDSREPEAALRMVDSLEGDLAGRVKALAAAALADGRIAISSGGDLIADALESFDRFPGASDAPWLEPAPGARLEHLDLAPPAELATADGIGRTVLENGLVLVTHTSRDSRTFAAHVLLRDRAAVEVAAGVPRGASDVVHRLMGLATESLDEDALRGRLAALGAKLKTTDSPYIPYDDYYFSPEYSYARLETIDTFGLEALALLGEAVTRPRFEEALLEKARLGAAQQADKEGASPRDQAAQLFYRTLGSGHPLANGVLGEAIALETLTLDDVRRLHAAMIAPARVVVTVSSGFPPARIEAIVREAFAGGPATETTEVGTAEVGTADPEVAEVADAVDAAPPPALPRFAPGTAPYPRHAEVETGKEQSWIEVGCPLDVPPADQAAVRLAAALLSERLAEKLREEEGLAYSIGAAVRLEEPGPCLIMAAGTRPDNLEAMREGMLAIARGMAMSPPSPGEIEGARNRGEGRQRMRRLSRIGQAYALSMLELRGRDPRQPDADLPALRAVTPDDIARVAGARFDFGREVVAIAR